MKVEDGFEFKFLGTRHTQRFCSRDRYSDREYDPPFCIGLASVIQSAHYPPVVQPTVFLYPGDLLHYGDRVYRLGSIGFGTGDNAPLVDITEHAP